MNASTSQDGNPNAGDPEGADANGHGLDDDAPAAAPLAGITIAPDTNTLTLDPGETFDESIIVTVPMAAGTPGIEHLDLVPSASVAPFVVSIAPAGGYGPLPGRMEHVLKFEVRFRGTGCRDKDQVFTGTLDVVADNQVVASKKVRVTVPACRPRMVRYSVKFVCGIQQETCGCASVAPGRYATQVSIHNYGQEAVRLRKRFIPLVLAGAPLGREPRFGESRAEDGIELPPHTATMDDCCRIGQLLYGAPVDALTIGILEITATRDVAVTAVYTTATGIDVVPVDGRPA